MLNTNFDDFKMILNYFSNQACMLAFYPEFDSTTLRNSEVIFLVDQSNSMYQSEAIVTARQILLLFLRELPNESLFNIILFGSGCHLLLDIS